MFRIVLICAIFGAAYAEPAGPVHHGYGPPPHHVPHKPPPPHPPKYHHKPVHYDPRPYAYSYGVEDEYHGVKFGQNEESDGKVVHGSYHVLLPDGRIQNVKYTADHYAGYIADVSYTNPHHAPVVYHKPKPYHPPPPPVHHDPYHG